MLANVARMRSAVLSQQTTLPLDAMMGNDSISLLDASTKLVLA